MIDALWEIADLARAIVGLLTVEILLNGVLIWICFQPTESNAPNALTESAPPNNPDALAKRRQAAAEEAEAWATLQHYSPEEAYGGEAP